MATAIIVFCLGVLTGAVVCVCCRKFQCGIERKQRVPPKDIELRDNPAYGPIQRRRQWLNLQSVYYCCVSFICTFVVFHSFVYFTVCCHIVYLHLLQQNVRPFDIWHSIIIICIICQLLISRYIVSAVIVWGFQSVNNSMVSNNKWMYCSVNIITDITRVLYFIWC